MKKWCLLLMLLQFVGLHAMEMEIDKPDEKSVAMKMLELALAESQNEFLEKIEFSDKKIRNLTNWLNDEHKKIDPQILCEIQSYPAFYTITHLNLSKNSLPNLPSGLKALSHIEYFDVSDNQFPAIPAVSSYWVNTLETLIVFGNKIKCIEKIGDQPLSNFKKLTFLNISKNQINELPCEELYELYLQQREQKNVFWVCVDRDYELNDELSKVRDEVFCKSDKKQIEDNMQIEEITD